MTPRTKLSSNEGVGKRLLNAREAAEFLGIAVDTVYRMARLRELPLGQGWAGVAVRRGSAGALRRATHNRNH